MKVLSQWRARLLVSLVVLIFAAAGDALAQTTLIPLTTRRDMVFDHSGNFLYIGTSDGSVRRYNISLGQLDATYNLGGTLNGLDIAPDDSALLVAQGTTNGSSGTLHRVNLSDGTITNISFPRLAAETGTWDVAIASNGLALLTTSSDFYNSMPLRQINLATNVISERTDAPGSFAGGRVNANTQLERSANRSRIHLMEDLASRHFTYDATIDQFGPGVTAGSSSFPTRALNRDGSLLALRGLFVAFEAVPALTFRRALRGVDGGIAFDATANRFYGVSSPAAQIVVYDTDSFRELYRLPIGETVGSGAALFGTGTLVASNDGRFVALATPSGIRLIGAAPQPPLPPPALPVFGTPRDMVFDHAGQRLYITTREGLVWPYNLSDRTFEGPTDLGGTLAGLDISADDSFLIVAQGDYGFAEGAFQKLNLMTGQVTNFNYTRAFSEAGGWDVAIGSNGRALATTTFNGTGWTPLRQLDLATGTTTPRIDAPGSGGSGRVGSASGTGTQIHRSHDGSRMYLLETGDPRFTYSATADTFGASDRVINFHLQGSSAAVNRNGMLLATRVGGSARVETAPAFALLGNFSTLTSGVAFDAVQDVVYGISTPASQIIAYDTNTFAERFRFDIGENFNPFAIQFDRGLLVASRDGRFLALNTGTTVRVYNLPAVQLISVASIKVHGGTPFALDLPLDGPRAVECRSGGSNGAYTMVFTFGQTLTSVAAASVTSGSGTISSSAIDAADPRRYVVNLAGVANLQNIKVTLSNLVDAAGNKTELISQQMAVLVGDTNGDRAVNSGDAIQTRNRSGDAVNATNFRSDVNSDGVINSGDALVVRSRAGTSLP